MQKTLTEWIRIIIIIKQEKAIGNRVINDSIYYRTFCVHLSLKIFQL